MMGKPLATVAMTDQHRATTKQWAIQEKWVDDDDDSACIIELRDRVEALEAQQRREDKLDRLIALDAADPNWEPDPAIAELRAASAQARPIIRDRDETGDYVIIRDTPPSTNSLVRQVALVITPASQTLNHEWACAAIREVAKWLRDGGDYSANAWANLLEKEADRG
jgi:hypothetical protein